jgi:apolipoprotein N-acyltransferase
MKKDISLSILSALVLIFSFPTVNLWIFAWVGVVPLLIALENKTPKQAFLLSYLTGIVFFGGILYWVIHVTLPGLVILVLYLGLYFGIFGFFVYLVTGHWSLVTLPAIWVLLEYLRSHLFTGFGWALLGYSQYLNLPFIQISDITGAFGVSFLIVMANVAVWQIISETRVKKNIICLLFPVLCLLFTFSYGLFKLNQKLTEPTIKVSVIQGNIPQEEKWEPQLKKAILEKYIRLTKLALRDKPDMVIWPETALPGYLDEPEINQGVVTLIRDIKFPLLIGAASESEGKSYNSAFLFSKEGKIICRYDKVHLVPFGEYVPGPFYFLRKFIEIGDFSPGDEYTIFKLSNSFNSLTHSTKFGVLICFEDIFPDLVRRFVKRDAVFMVNITNDAWFKKTSSPYQHLQASVFRAVENRVNLIRCANTGFSGFIDPFGKIIGRVSDEEGDEIFVMGYKTEEITLAKQNTFYTKFGDLFSLLCVFVVMVYLVFLR